MRGKIHIQTWMAAEVVATLAEWLAGRGKEPRSMSQLIELMAEELVEIAISNGARAVIDESEVTQVIESIALNRYRGRALSKLGAVAQRAQGPAALRNERDVLQALRTAPLKSDARPAYENAFRNEHGIDVPVRNPKREASGPNTIDAKTRAEIERATQSAQFRAAVASSSSDNSAYEAAVAAKAIAEGIPAGQETASEPNEGEFSVETARKQMEE